MSATSSNPEDAASASLPGGSGLAVVLLSARAE